MNLDSRWLRNVPPDDRAKFEQAIRNDTFVLGRMLAILEDEYVTSERIEESEAQFDNPNWQYLTAYRAGQRNKLKQVMTLLNFLKE